MKKTLVIIFVLVMAMLLSACAQKAQGMKKREKNY